MAPELKFLGAEKFSKICITLYLKVICLAFIYANACIYYLENIELIEIDSRCSESPNYAISFGSLWFVNRTSELASAYKMIFRPTRNMSHIPSDEILLVPCPERLIILRIVH